MFRQRAAAALSTLTTPYLLALFASPPSRAADLIRRSRRGGLSVATHQHASPALPAVNNDSRSDAVNAFGCHRVADAWLLATHRTPNALRICW